MPKDFGQISVCMFPRSETNEFLGLMSDALERTGRVKIANFRYVASLFSRADLFHVHWEPAGEKAPAKAVAAAAAGATR